MAEVDARKLLAQAKDLSARYARRLGPDEAADLVGEALTRGLERPPADGRMEPWLERITRNLLVDRWRHAEVAARVVPEPPPPPRTPEELALEGERRRAIRRSLARLPREHRRTILQRYYDAGGAGGVPATTGRTRLHRALARLRRLTRGLLTLVPPWRAFHWLPLAANPAALAVFLLSQPASPPAPMPVPHAAPVARMVVHHAATSSPGPAPATPAVPPGKPAPRAAPSATAAPVLQHYDFDDDQVEGELESPDTGLIVSVRPVRRPSLIEIPGSFVSSVIKSIEDL
jgi:DNA-directed RNA polymerase specialized sigma24 family protein